MNHGTKYRQRVSRSLDFPFEQLRDFDSLVNRFWGREGQGNMGLAPYAVDVREDADHIYVDAELPAQEG
jgi:HSP20 family molecular chaperone IbpA